MRARIPKIRVRMQRRREETPSTPPEQVIRKVNEGQKLLAESNSIDEVAKHLVVMPSTWHRWVAQYGVSLRIGMAGRLAHSTAAIRGLPSLMPATWHPALSWLDTGVALTRPD